MTDAITTLSLRKVYRSRGDGKQSALVDLNLSVRRGDIFGFIGPNGAGKTTTIKILTGLIWPTAGDAYIFGQPAGTIHAKIKMGYLSEVSYYYDFMEAEKLLHFYGSLHGLDRSVRYARVKEALGAVNLLDKRKTRLREFSKGMQQRFGIAQALIARPPLLILDEPTSGLDPIAQKEIKDIILNLKSQGITIFFSSHQLTQVENICDKIGIIHNGKMLRTGDLSELLREASHDMSKLVYRYIGDELHSLLIEKGLNPEHEGNDLFKVLVPSKDVHGLLELIEGKGGSLHLLDPYSETLENLFFNLIQHTGDLTEH
jgi:ABC-2 type transport system ATP-binding protein